MKIKALITTLTIFQYTISLHAQKIDSVLVCNVKFNESKFNNPHAGSGFVLEYEGKIYAITAKHVLFFAKTDDMKTISFGKGDLKEWAFHPKEDSTKSIVAGMLLNENPEEVLDFAKIAEGDWLIFEVEGDIPENVATYKLREKELQIGEKLRFLGYPYKGSMGNKPLKIAGTLTGFTDLENLKMEVPAAHYNGCSGGPVIDQKGNLVGIVSMGFYNEKTGEIVFEPASTKYFKEVVNSLK